MISMIQIKLMAKILKEEQKDCLQPTIKVSKEVILRSKGNNNQKLKNKNNQIV